MPCPGLALAFGLFWLAWILGTLLYEGGTALAHASLYYQMTPPPGGDGGLANAIAGSLVMVPRGTLIGTPVGILAGTLPRRVRPRGWLAGGDPLPQRRAAVGAVDRHRPVRLLGLRRAGAATSRAGPAPSRWRCSSIPVVVRTTDDMLKLVPNTLREAAMALGCPAGRWSTMVTYRAARTGIVTGILLAIARISGETAPLLFTALNNQFWSTNMNAPMANLPVVIFQFAMSPYEDWHRLAWGGAALITLAVLALNIIARALFRKSD